MATATNSQNITRECHVLPVCYQQAFTKTDGELFVQFLDKDKPLSLHPRVVGKINDFYTRTINGVDDDGIERFFNLFVEGPYASFVKRITELKDDFVLQPDELPILLRFVATQVVRTQAHCECINKQAGMTVPRGVLHHNMYRKMKLIADRWARQTPEMILWTSRPFVGVQFITGDNPVVCFTQTDGDLIAGSRQLERRIIDLNVSLEDPHSGFIVPLSPYLCLNILNSPRRNHIRLRPTQCTDPAMVSHVNQMVYSQCVQFVAARDSEYLSFHRRCDVKSA